MHSPVSSVHLKLVKEGLPKNKMDQLQHWAWPKRTKQQSHLGVFVLKLVKKTHKNYKQNIQINICTTSNTISTENQ